VLYDFVLVPVPTTIDKDTTSFIINQTEAAVFIGSMAAVECNLESLLSHVKLIIVTDRVVLQTVTESVKTRLMTRPDIHVEVFANVLTLGERNVLPHIVQSNPTSNFTILYTSGSTGAPKGAVMTNKRWNDFICAPYMIPS
jgi:long-subunit acyl-CoA synthetase (AMP-forming)